jgi:DNA processing protein
MLIRESRAKLARSAGDVLEDMGWLVRDRPQRAKQRELRTDLSLFENRIVSVLESAAEPLQIDVLSERAEIEVQDMLVHLLQLEFKSVVRQLAGKQFMLVD